MWWLIQRTVEKLAHLYSNVHTHTHTSLACYKRQSQSDTLWVEKHTSILWTAYGGHVERSWDWPMDDSQQEKGNLSCTTPRNLILPTKRMRLEVSSSSNEPQSLLMRTQSSWQPGISLVILIAENPSLPCQTYDLQNCELTSGYCFKLLSFWWFVMQQ